MTTKKSYYDSEIESLKLHEGLEFKPTIQIHAPNGNKTKHFSITREQVEKIRAILNEDTADAEKIEKDEEIIALVTGWHNLSSEQWDALTTPQKLKYYRSTL